ncbi:MAG TPA: hypothetical protein VEX70_10055 [Pyrinomonadaceae bacterium]|jgi:hypothetical protein|nr:hypothetical protein [Pyrinomonadaceae bacterium]
MTTRKNSTVDKVLLYTSTGALVAVAMLVPFAVLAVANEIFDLNDLWSVLCFLIVGLLMARVIDFIVVPRRPMR